MSVQSTEDIEYLSYVALGSKVGQIYLGSQEIYHDAGSLLLSILDMPEYDYQKLAQMISDFEDALKSRDTIATLASIVTIFTDAQPLGCTDLNLFKLLTMLPAYSLYQSALTAIKQVNLATTEVALYQSALPINTDGSPDFIELMNRQESFKIRNSSILEVLQIYEPIYRWCRALNGATDISDLTPAFVDKIYDVASTYLVSLKHEHIELSKLQSDLNYQFSNGNRSYIESILDAKVFFPPFPIKFDVRPQEVYATTSLSSLCALSFRCINVTNHHLKKCDLCGRYFIASRSNIKYCSKPNDDYSGNPCCKVGAVTVFSRRESNLILGTKYRKQYTTYAQWRIQQKTKRIPELKEFIWACAEGKTEERQAVVDDEVSKMEDEIDSLFRAWNTAAKKAVAECTLSTVNENSALLDLPTISERGPKLASWVADAKKAKGIKTKPKQEV